ncbi:hypothetical protein B0H13DRAFT_2261903 [Mycena leptocephala]|nr:hypothetical protein B0H13DRAFT_2261903 [Mycena leptocephala]
MKEIASDGQSSMTRKYNLGHFCLRVESSEATEFEAMPKDIALIMGRRKKQVVVGVVPSLSFESHHKIVGSNAFAYWRVSQSPKGSVEELFGPRIGGNPYSLTTLLGSRRIGSPIQDAIILRSLSIRISSPVDLSGEFVRQDSRIEEEKVVAVLGKPALMHWNASVAEAGRGKGECSPSPLRVFSIFDDFTSTLLPNATEICGLRDILRSNALPPDILPFRRINSAVPADLVLYNAAIERAQKPLDRSISSRDILARYADGCRSILAPIRRLPTELLVDIFEMCCPASRLPDATTFKEELNRLGRWHFLQLSECSRFIIFRHSEAESSVDNSVLGHSGSPRSQPVLAVLATHARRWKGFALSCDLESSQHLSGAKDNLHQLEKLSLICIVNWRTPDIFQLAHATVVTGFNIDVSQISLHISSLGIFECAVYRSFTFQPRSDQGPLPMWHAEHFLKLAERSSFHSHLTRLEITVVMTDEALLGCLTVLPLLAELAISDGTPSREHIFSFLITDALLQGTQISDETALIPALEVLCLQSLLRFDDSVYLQLVVSRLKEDFDNPFETYLEWLAPWAPTRFRRELLEEHPDDQRGLWFYCGPARLTDC